MEDQNNPDNLSSENIQTAQNTDLQQQADDHFPPKPEMDTQEVNVVSQSFVSLVMFIVVFAFVYDWDYQYMLMLVGVLLIHELGHYLAMKYYDYSDLSIFFIPLLGAAASGHKEQVSQKQHAVILLAGPLPGILIGSVFMVIALSSGNDLYTKLANLFIFINIFNLLPIMPLDGGRLIKTLYFNSNETITNVFLVISIALMSYIAVSTASYALLLVPLFLLLQISLQFQMKKVKKALAEKNIALNQKYSELSNKDYWLIRDELGTHIRGLSKTITPFHYEESNRENDVIKQIKELLRSKDIADLTTAGKVIFTVIWILSFVIPVLFTFTYYLVNKGH